MNLFRKATELLTYHQPNDLNNFIKSTQNVISILSSGAIDEAKNLSNNFNNIKTKLINECNKNDKTYLNYIIENSLLLKYTELLTKQTPSEHVIPILNFFLIFLSPQLKENFPHVSIHNAITNIITKLESLNFKCPDAVYEFAISVWNACYNDPIILEMMFTLNDKQEKIYPIIDFFCNASTTFTKIGSKAREILLLIFTKNQEEIDDTNFFLRNYTKNILNPIIVNILKSIIGYAGTIQFSGSLSMFLQWVDQYLLISGDFRIEDVFDEFDELSTYQKLICLSFYLSTFMAPIVIDYVVDFTHSENIIKIVMNSLSIEKKDDKELEASIVLLKAIMKYPKLLPYYLPPINQKITDILSILPSQWLVDDSSSSSLEAYVHDAIIRINSYPQRTEDGFNNEIYLKLLSVLNEFQKLTISCAFSITQLITIIISVAPDLINDELAHVVENIIVLYKDVEIVKINDFSKLKDSKELRATIICEFAKEIHSTFIASEKLKNGNSE